jgi:hypothetical protein
MKELEEAYEWKCLKDLSKLFTSFDCCPGAKLLEVEIALIQ